jgi:uncharacterized protein (TIGR02145 family)
VDTYGKNLKTAFQSVWKNSDNTLGFSAIPSGYRTAEGSYTGAGNTFRMWTFVNDYDASTAMLMLVNDAAALNYDEVSKRVGASVRCIKIPD